MPQPPNDSQDSKRYKIRRSVILGLGGTGRNVCTQLKRVLLEQADHDPARFSHVRFLSIDTDARVKEVLTRQGERVGLDSEEILGLRIPPAFNARRLHRVMNEPLRSYLPQANDLGAMRSRPIGNAFLLVNWSNIRSKVKNLLYQLARADLRAMVRTDPRYRGLDLDSNKLDIYVVGNLVSGTGSGMALGMGYLLRDLTAEISDGNTEYHTEGIFTVCGAYALNDVGGQPSPYAVNCYAALLELNHFSNRDVFLDRDDGFDPGFDPVSISPDARRKAPYEYVQLLNPSHSSAGELSHEELEPHIAQVLALRIGSAVGMTATAKVIDELPNRSRWDEKGNLRFCWAWGANTFRSSGQEVLDLATTLAADEALDVMTGEHVRTTINLKDEAWNILSSVGFGYSEDSRHNSLLKSLLTTEEPLDDLPAGVSLVDGIEQIITRAFPQPPEGDRDMVRSLPSLIDRRKGELSVRLSGWISSVAAANRRRLALEIRDRVESELLELADYTRDGKGSLDDAVGVIDLLVGSEEERSALLEKDSQAYQGEVQAALAEGRRGRRETEAGTESIRAISSVRGRFHYQALVGAWDQFVKGLVKEKVSEAREVALEEARKILDGDGSDQNDTLRLGLIRHLERLRTRLRTARQQIQRLDARFEARIEALEANLRRRGEDHGRLEEARELKSQALEGENLRVYARKIADQVLGEPHAVLHRYDDPGQLDKDYAKVDEILRERLLEIGSDRLAASIEEAPDFGGHLPTLLERSEPAIRLDPNHDRPPEVAYLSIPRHVPAFREAVKTTGWLAAREIVNKREDELFQERLTDSEPRVDVLVGRLTFSPASVIGIDRWAHLYGRATVSSDGRRSVHTLPDPRGGDNLVFEDLGQTGTRVQLAYLLARSQLWLRQNGGETVYEYPRDEQSLLRASDRKVFTSRFEEATFLEELKTPVQPGVRDRDLAHPVFVHALRRFRQAMKGGVDRETRDAMFGRLVIGVAQVASGQGELGLDPHLPSSERSDDFRAFENGLRSLLEPLNLAGDLYRRVRELSEVPPLGEIDRLQGSDRPQVPFGAPPPPETHARYGETLIDPVDPVDDAATSSLRQACPNGHPVGSEARFCPVCGEKVPRPAGDARCAACRAPLDADARFCSRCGAPADGPADPGR